MNNDHQGDVRNQPDGDGSETTNGNPVIATAPG